MAYENIKDKGFDTRTTEELREITRKAGIRSGEVRKEKATMKKTLEMLLDEKSSKGKTYRELATLGLLKGAIQGKADNYKTILTLLGEIANEEITEAPSVQINIVNNEDLEKILYEEEE